MAEYLKLLNSWFIIFPLPTYFIVLAYDNIGYAISKSVSLSWRTKRIYIIEKIYSQYLFEFSNLLFRILFEYLFEEFINVWSSKPSPCQSNFPFWESCMACMVSELTCWRLSVVGQTWRIMFLLRNLIFLPSWRTAFWMRLCNTGVYDPYSFGKDWTLV